jgi:methionine synthase I (cobalamin-dependent)
MREVVAAGAAIVGGCCGTTPSHVRALATQVKKGV